MRMWWIIWKAVFRGRVTVRMTFLIIIFWLRESEVLNRGTGNGTRHMPTEGWLMSQRILQTELSRMSGLVFWKICQSFMKKRQKESIRSGNMRHHCLSFLRDSIFMRSWWNLLTNTKKMKILIWRVSTDSFTAWW